MTACRICTAGACRPDGTATRLTLGSVALTGATTRAGGAAARARGAVAPSNGSRIGAGVPPGTASLSAITPGADTTGEPSTG